MTASQEEAIVTVPPFDFSIPTLGFEVIDWIERWLIQPDGARAGKPFRLTREQKNFILWYYAIDRDKAEEVLAAALRDADLDDSDEERPTAFLYRRAVLRRSKGWGKSPFMAAIALAELCGPVCFAGWDEDGDPIGAQHPLPWIQIAGVSEAQANNTYDAVVAMAADPDFQDVYGLDVGRTRVLMGDTGICKIEKVTASAATLEGGRPTFVIMDETHHWTASNGGHKIMRVVRRNLGKTGGRSIETTNAHEPGEDSTAERSYFAYRAIVEGRTRRADVLYDSREAPADCDLADEPRLRAILRVVYGDATWLDLDRLIGEIYDPDTPPEEARRFYLNQIVAAADSWTEPRLLMANKTDDLRPLEFGNSDAAKGWRHGDRVALGFDGSLTDDSTALVAVRIDDGSAWLLGVWEKPEGPAGAKWEVPKDQVRDAVDHAFATLDVVAFFSDVAYWETDIDDWREAYGERLLIKATTRHAIGWDMRSHKAENTYAAESLHRAITDGTIPFREHFVMAQSALRGDEIMVRHILNARRRVNQYGTSFGKENRESPRKVDIVAALLLARMARGRLIADGKGTQRRGRVAAF